MDDDFLKTRRYLEQYGSAIVMRNYLMVGVVLLAVLNILQAAFTFRVYSEARNQRPIVIRTDEAGRATPIDYDPFNYEPQDRELRFFLIEFVTKHFSRIPATVNQRYAQSLFFLDKKLSDALVEHERKEQSILKFLREGTDEIDIKVINVALHEVRIPPYRASVTFEKVFYSRADHRELRSERYEGSFEFSVREEVPNEWIPVNPLGLIITYFRVDQAFEAPRSE